MKLKESAYQFTESDLQSNIQVTGAIGTQKLHSIVSEFFSYLAQYKSSEAGLKPGVIVLDSSSSLHPHAYYHFMKADRANDLVQLHTVPSYSVVLEDVKTTKLSCFSGPQAHPFSAMAQLFAYNPRTTHESSLHLLETSPHILDGKVFDVPRSMSDNVPALKGVSEVKLRSIVQVEPSVRVNLLNLTGVQTPESVTTSVVELLSEVSTQEITFCKTWTLNAVKLYQRVRPNTEFTLLHLKELTSQGLHSYLAELNKQPLLTAQDEELLSYFACFLLTQTTKGSAVKFLQDLTIPIEDNMFLQKAYCSLNPNFKLDSIIEKGSILIVEHSTDSDLLKLMGTAIKCAFSNLALTRHKSSLNQTRKVVLAVDDISIFTTPESQSNYLQCLHTSSRSNTVNLVITTQPSDMLFAASYKGATNRQAANYDTYLSAFQLHFIFGSSNPEPLESLANSYAPASPSSVSDDLRILLELNTELEFSRAIKQIRARLDSKEAIILNRNYWDLKLLPTNHSYPTMIRAYRHAITCQQVVTAI